MKIYIVTDGEYCDYHIERVFTDKNQAELFCATYECYLEEYETDETIIQSNKKPKKIWRYGINYRGEFGVVTDDRFTFSDIQVMGQISGRVSLDANIESEKALKIISDKYAQWKSDQNNI